MNTVSIDVPTLKQVCYEGFSYFHELGKVKTCSGGHYTYIDNGSNILAVAHLDTVMGYSGKKGKFKQFGRTVMSTELDDRLGVHILLNELPKLGIVCDILLTEGEEKGRSTAQFFTSEKQYNWMFQFDRHGLWPVLYEYESDDLCKKLFTAGFDYVDVGSFSDICSLNHLGCVGINFGTGYEREHTYDCFAKLTTTERSILLFAQFYNMFKDEHMPYDAPVYSSGWKSPSYYDSYDEWFYDKYGLGRGHNPRIDVKTGNRVYGGPFGASSAENEEGERWEYDTDAQIAAYVEAAKRRKKKKTTIEDSFDWIVCPQCKLNKTEEDYSFTYNMCYDCMDSITGSGGL